MTITLESLESMVKKHLDQLANELILARPRPVNRSAGEITEIIDAIEKELLNRLNGQESLL